MSKAVDPDLDALERAELALIDIEGAPAVLVGPREVLETLTWCLPSLIQRLREAEATDYFDRAEHYESLYVATLNRATAAESRIAQLERALRLIATASCDQVWDLANAAFVAMEEK